MTSNMKISQRDKLILLTYPIIGIILILVIAFDPLNFFDNSLHKLIIGLIVASIPFVPFLYHRKKIMSKAKRKIKIISNIVGFCSLISFLKYLLN